MKRIISIIASIFLILNLFAVPTSRPKLVVEIVVDQLRTDYVEFLQSSFSDKGFNLLRDKGLYMRDVEFDVPGIDKVSSTAMLVTGAWPSDAGIPAAKVFDQKSNKMVASLSDPSTLGNFTNEAYSPANLLLSTVSDELAIDGAGLGEIHSIACDPQMAVILAGHAGTSAVWIDNITGNWASSAYYGDMPKSASQRNHRNSLAQRAGNMLWKPLLPLEKYAGLPAQKKYYSFTHTFPTADKDVFRRLVASPLGNTEITDLAIDYLNNMKLGNRGDVIDMLALGYTAAPYKYVKDGDYRIELQDTYLRLDADIARLLETIEKTVGLDNALIVVTSTGYYNDATPDDPKFKIPSGDFSTKRAVSLLNAFLSAKYGNGDYVAAFTDGQLYLNHRNLENVRADIGEVTTLAREFLCKMSGIRGAMTLSEVLACATPEAARLNRRIVPAKAADIFVDFVSGWNVTDDIVYPPVTTPVRTTLVNSPAFILGASLPQSVTSAAVPATALASTVTQLLRLRSPNGSLSRPLPL